jgi:cation diffusion facilitator CzcD-associated flavoprotein CzcO
MTETRRRSVLVVGGGSVGAIAALNLHIGGLASVTVALRSNYHIVNEHGYNIESCDHGLMKGFRPSIGALACGSDISGKVANAPQFAKVSQISLQMAFRRMTILSSAPRAYQTSLPPRWT